MRPRLSGTPRSDGTWQLTVVLTDVNGGKVRKTLYAKTQVLVQEKARKLLYESGRVAPASQTIAELVEYCEGHVWTKLAPRTQEQYIATAKRIVKRWGTTRVGELATSQIYAWLTLLAKDAGPRTVQITRNVLRVTLQQAVFLGWIQTNPAAGWVLPIRMKSKPSVPISPEQVRVAIGHAPDRHYRLWLWTLWETAMRPDEATRISAVNLVDKETLGWWILVPGTKTAAALRQVPITYELAQALLDLPEPWFDYSRRRWTELWHKTQINAGWRPKGTRLKREAPETPLPKLYALRKARITAWGDMGLTDEVWAKLAGHEDATLTKKVYDRVSTERIAKQLGLGLVCGDPPAEEGK